MRAYRKADKYRLIISLIMRAVILAGGFAKRMWPYTLNKSKVLLDIAGRPVIQHIIEKLEALGPERIYVSTNKRFENDFRNWLENTKNNHSIDLVVENSLLEEQKLGSLGALKMLIKSRKIKNDLLVIAGDNIFDFDLSAFLPPASKNIQIGLYNIKQKEKAGRFGVVEIDKNRKIISFEEKPKRPKTSLISTGIYFFPKDHLNRISEYLREGNNPDAPGYFISWLHKKQDVFGFVFRGKWLDIGSMEAYERAKKEFS